MPLFTNSQARTILRNAFVDVMARKPFKLNAICLLPNHIHLLMRLPEDDADYPMRIREIKRLFSRDYLANIGSGAPRNESRQKKNEAAIWQRRYWEHFIRDENDLNHHMTLLKKRLDKVYPNYRFAKN
jgi:putative transposase